VEQFRSDARQLLVVVLALTLAVPSVQAVELRPKTARVFDDYIATVRNTFDGDVRTGSPLAAIPPRDMMALVRDGRILIRPAHEDGITRIDGGLIHHWRGAAFIADVTLDEAVAVSQDYANYHRVYEPILNSRVLEHGDDRFRVLMRLHKRSGVVSAVLDVWSVVQYERTSDSVVYSASDSERIMDVEDAGKKNERRLPAEEGRGYLWRASTFSRLSQQDGGVLVELENVGLSRAFPPLLGWIIEPIARRVGRGSVEESLSEFRTAVLAAHRDDGSEHSQDLAPELRQ
jgi:hypothetical protein